MKSSRKKPLECRQIKADGTRCKALAGQSGFCSIHSGFKPRLNTSIDLNEGVAHIKKFLIRLILKTEGGQIKPTQSNAIKNLCSKLMECYQMLEVEQKIKDIAKMLERQNNKGYSTPDIACLTDLEDEPKKLRE